MNQPDALRSQGRHAGLGFGSAEAEVPPVLEQVSLEQVLERRGPMAPQQAAVIGLAVLDQLVALHNRGMLHGDVRPGSVLLGPHDQISLAGPNLPSPAFTAPEGVTSPAADLWSLGATLYSSIEGHSPSPGGSLQNAGPIAPILFHLLSGDPAQRPHPGILRNVLLDISQNRGEALASLPSVPGNVLPPRVFPAPLGSEAPAPFGSATATPTPLGLDATVPFERTAPGAPAPSGHGTPRVPAPPGPGNQGGPGVPEAFTPGGPGPFIPQNPHNPGGSGNPGAPGVPEPFAPGAPGAPGPFGSGNPGGLGPFGSGAPSPFNAGAATPSPPDSYGRTSPPGVPPSLHAQPSLGVPASPVPAPVPVPAPAPAPDVGMMRDVPLVPSSPNDPAGPTERSSSRVGVLVPRSIVALTGTLLVGMAVTIGVLLAPLLGGSGESDPAAEPTAGAEGRFAAAPRACSLLDEKQAGEVVPGFKSTEVEVGECNWLNQHDWRNPSVEKFDLRVRLVAQKQNDSGIERAKEYLSSKKKDLLEKGNHTTPKPVPPKDMKGIGEEAFTSAGHNSINLYGGSYKVTVVFRVSNLIAEVEYEQGGVKEDADGEIAAGAEKVARWLTESLKTDG